jgi:alpha-tubulin suppressor-like RCC1 family protein
VTWGDPDYGGDGPRIDVDGPFDSIYSTGHAFAALKKDGNVVTWGDSRYGGGDTDVTELLSPSEDVKVVRLYSTDTAFAALKSDGSVVMWGNGMQTTAIQNIDKIYTNQHTFAAIKTNHSVVAWGEDKYGGTVPTELADEGAGVVKIYSSSGAFAALKSDGSVVTWGLTHHGGDSRPYNNDPNDTLNYNECGITKGHISSGVVKIYSTSRAFAALKSDGSVVTWGPKKYGGNTTYSTDDNPNPYGIKLTNGSSLLDHNFVVMYSNGMSFVALTTTTDDNDVVTCHVLTWGGFRDVANIADANNIYKGTELQFISNNITDFTNIDIDDV